jgi:esterase/lipase superfamily enzyme
MSPRFWMITNRRRDGENLNSERGPVTYWVADGGDPTVLTTWTKTGATAFKTLLAQAADELGGSVKPDQQEDQPHVTLLVHGYNNTWADAAARYRSLCNGLFSGDTSLGLCILFTWPSFGSPVDYLPDRSEARDSAGDLADVLSELYDWLIKKQADGFRDSTKACRAKTSLIAHSMGNYVLQKAMQLAWSRKNQPLLVSLLNQLLMVAADVDNDLFKSGEVVERADGDAIGNFTYRVTALFTGRDPVLGLSAGLKHFGKRRLGRSGLDKTVPCPDNVWAWDCSDMFRRDQDNIHSAYFEEPKTIELMRQILRGVDRTVLVRQSAATTPQGQRR